jgi:hypothetical protein
VCATSMRDAGESRVEPDSKPVLGPSAQQGHRELERHHALAALMHP